MTTTKTGTTLTIITKVTNDNHDDANNSLNITVLPMAGRVMGSDAVGSMAFPAGSAFVGSFIDISYYETQELRHCEVL